MVALDRLPTPAEMIAHLDRHVAGQERAKKLLATAVYQHYLGLALRDLADGAGPDMGRHHALLLGPTGCGKTLLVQTLAKLLGVPVAFIAATSLVETGYVGEHADSALAALWQLAGQDIARAERGIVFLDEFDKLRRVVGHGRDVSGEGVQNALLALLDGSPARFRARDQVLTLDASRVLFVCTGAFADLPDAIRRRLVKRNALGFAATSAPAKTYDDSEALARVTTQDLVDYGLIPELVGRFTTIAPLHALSLDDLTHILGGVAHSALARAERQFAVHGVKLDVPDDTRRAIAERAAANGTGARGLASLLRGTLEDVTWRLPDLADEDVRGVRVPREAVTSGAPVQFVRRAPREPRRSEPTRAEDLRAHALTPPTPARLRESRLLAEISKLDNGATADRIRTLQSATGYSRLSEEEIAFWDRYTAEMPTGQILLLLEGIHEQHADLSTLLEALRTTGVLPSSALVHYACFLREKRRYEKLRARRRRTERRGNKDRPDDPTLDF